MAEWSPLCSRSNVCDSGQVVQRRSRSTLDAGIEARDEQWRKRGDARR